MSASGSSTRRLRGRGLLPLNRSSRVPLLTKEGSGEVLQWRVGNLLLAPSLVRRGFIGPTDSRRAGPVLGTNGERL